MKTPQVTLPTQSPTIIILAAGLGSRFLQSGGDTHKLEAPLNGIPVLDRVLRTAADSKLPYHIVHQVAGEVVGMGESISRGVRATEHANGWLILPGDLPLATANSLLQVAQNLASCPVVAPVWCGQWGHPVGFGPECFDALIALRGDSGAASIVKKYQQAGTALMLLLDDQGIVLDIDTVEDLTQAEEILKSRNK
ncbi:NTP transferase domain-containing protein [Pseudomonas putida]|uniref:nucleotidyltransferase family protein n=1 Tax=Pseudomonas putida TaxID=303 RepID=UPI0021F823E2|nr:nucleotidyltransferase family protein [Pseudomonas putida]